MTAGDQLDLLTGRKPPVRRAPASTEPARELPVAQVVVESAVPHLDRVFDYLVPASLHERAQPGVRCVVRLAGRRINGFIVARAEDTEHTGTLQPLLDVPSPVPVLTPHVLATCRRVAARHAGVLADVLRLAVPPRHARTEKSYLEREAGASDVASGRPALPEEMAGGPGAGDPGAGVWELPAGGVAFLTRVRDRQAPRAVVVAPPGRVAAPPDGAEEFRPRWAALVASAAAAAVGAGQGVVVVVPDAADLDIAARALDEAGLAGRHTRLSADLGQAARYRAFLRVMHGDSPVVLGTRAAAFAPVAHLGLVVCVDDVDPLHAEPRAPYPHTRDVLATRAELAGAAMLVIGPGCSVESAAMVADGWARLLTVPRPVLRELAPRVQTAADDEYRDPAARLARVPSLMLRTIRDGLESGPVLVQVPRTGYVSRLDCARCRTPAGCRHCHGPLRLTEPGAAPSCRWCARVHRDWRCPECGGQRLRWSSVGSERTGEELGRALPGVTMRFSSSTAEGGVRATVPDRPALVVATVGAEPLAPTGYAAAVLLDATTQLAAPVLDVSVQAARRWLAAAALVRPAADGGRVIIAAEPGLAAVQALVRWDPAGLAAAELAERAPLGLPPAGVIAEAVGPTEALAAFRDALRLPADATLVEEPPEPGTDPPTARLLVHAPAALLDDVARALAQARAVTSAAKVAALPRVRVRATL